MEIKDQVCSLELARRLKELGVEKESYFEWLFYPEKMEWKASPAFKNQIGYSAYTASELGELLPNWVQIKRNDNQFEVGTLTWINKCEYDWNCYAGDRYLANALAKMLIFLLENKLIEEKQ